MNCNKCCLSHDEDNLFREVAAPMMHHHHHDPTDFATDVSEDEGNIYVSIHVPGIKLDKISIAVEGNKLRVIGKRERTEEPLASILFMKK